LTAGVESQSLEPPRLGERLAARSIHLLVAGLGATLRVRGASPSPALAEVARTGRPTLVVVWHHQLFLASWLLARDLVRRGVPMVVLISRSRDGSIAAEVGRLLGADVVRGSTSRGGGAALRQLVRAANAGRTPLIIPDGPRGPALSCKPGAIALATLAELPVLPLGLAVDRCWRLRSWDRLVVPKPFARLSIVAGEARRLPSDLDEPGREAARRALEAELNQLTAAAADGG
jgi:lysophospholipid acyltransferase (LPLAT)-like uncharacterized protein